MLSQPDQIPDHKRWRPGQVGDRRVGAPPGRAGIRLAQPVRRTTVQPATDLLLSGWHAGDLAVSLATGGMSRRRWNYNSVAAGLVASQGHALLPAPAEAGAAAFDRWLSSLLSTRLLSVSVLYSRRWLAARCSSCNPRHRDRSQAGPPATGHLAGSGRRSMPTHRYRSWRARLALAPGDRRRRTEQTGSCLALLFPLTQRGSAGCVYPCYFRGVLAEGNSEKHRLFLTRIEKPGIGHRRLFRTTRSMAVADNGEESWAGIKHCRGLAGGLADCSASRCGKLSRGPRGSMRKSGC